ncbi:calcium-binding protein [Microvirga pudoricolor]|uniref:calcium-binding protein n=1 Tax=Microvirga pudoricolor TaxID=2778729 RepID=UPI00194F55B1|nr:calcium-binding protein [Microvirga pudoricolor]MBM6595698.1 calcium-binding protein [Microvirga pudoricolor]
MTLKDLGYYTDGTKEQDWVGQFTGKNGVTSKTQLLGTPSLQDKVFDDMLKLYWKYAQQSNFHMTDHLGDTISGILITPSVIVAGSHLAGIGKMRDFLDAKGAGYATDSGLVKYLSGLSGYDIPFVSGSSPQVATPSKPPTTKPSSIPSTVTNSSAVTVAKVLAGDAGANILVGTPGNDVIKGLGGRDKLVGGAGADQLFGGAGNDVLKGGAGADTLWGGPGRDTLWGGKGKDTFAFKSASHANGDRIMDFRHGDKIDLSAIDAQAGKAGNQSFAFDGAKKVNKAGHVFYHEDLKAGVTHVHGNTGATQFEIALKGVKLGLTKADFVL